MNVRVIEERQENHQENENDKEFKKVREKLMEDRQRQNNIFVLLEPLGKKKKEQR